MTILFIGDKRSDFYNMAHEYTFLLFTIFNFRFFNWKKIVFIIYQKSLVESVSRESEIRLRR